MRLSEPNGASRSRIKTREEGLGKVMIGGTVTAAVIVSESSSADGIDGGNMRTILCELQSRGDGSAAVQSRQECRARGSKVWWCLCGNQGDEQANG